jgi:hypothetical protein
MNPVHVRTVLFCQYVIQYTLRQLLLIAFRATQTLTFTLVLPSMISPIHFSPTFKTPRAHSSARLVVNSFPSPTLSPNSSTLLDTPFAASQAGSYKFANFFSNELTNDWVLYGDMGPYRRKAARVSYHVAKRDEVVDVWYRNVEPSYVAESVCDGR